MWCFMYILKCLVQKLTLFYTIQVLVRLCEGTETNLQSSKILRTCCSHQNNFKQGSCDNANLQHKFPFANQILHNFKNKEFSNRTIYFGNDIKTSLHKNEHKPRTILNLTYTEDFVCKGISEIRKFSVRNFDETLNLLIDSSKSFVQYENYYIPKSSICVDQISKNGIVLVFCKPVCKNSINEEKSTSITKKESTSACLPKCCQLGKLLSTSGKISCQDFLGSEHWKPLIQTKSSNVQVQWIYTPPKNLCTSGIFLTQKGFLHFPKSPVRVLEDGQVLRKERSHWIKLKKETYCIEGILPANNPEMLAKHQIEQVLPSFNSVYGPTQANNNSEKYSSIISELGKIETVVFRCTDPVLPEHGNEYIENFELIITIGSFTSAFFVFVTILVYIVLWETQNIHGWTLVCSFTSLCGLYIFLGFMHLYHKLWENAANQRTISCWIIGVGLHFSYLSFFSWASIVNLDLWNTFRSFQASISQQNRMQMIRRFLKYAVFGIGLPFFVVALSIYMDFLYRSIDSSNIEDPPEYILPDPDYGSDYCFLAKNDSPIFYLIGPIGTLLVVNIGLTIATLIAIYKAQRLASTAASNSSTSNKRHKQSLKLFLKLLFVMGIFWVFDILSFTINRDFVPWYFAIFDLINVSHGFFVFLIFVCKKSTIKLLSQKYRNITYVRESFRRRHRRQSSTSGSRKFQGTSTTSSSVIQNFSSFLRQITGNNNQNEQNVEHLSTRDTQPFPFDQETLRMNNSLDPINQLDRETTPF